MARVKSGVVPAKQAAKRPTGVRGSGEKELLPEAGSGKPAPGAPVVHRVVLGKEPGGQPVNLLELLMEDSPRGDRTTSMDVPGRYSAPAAAPTRSNAELTMSMEAVGLNARPAPSEFTAVLQAFEPAAVPAKRVQTQTERPQVGKPKSNTEGSGHTQIVNLPDTKAAQSIGSNSQASRQPASIEQVGETAVQPALVRATPASALHVESLPVAAASMTAWVPWLLVAISIELLAILLVLLLGMKH